MSGRVPASSRLTADAIDAGALGGAGAATAALLHAGAVGACATAVLALLLGRAVLAPRGLAPGPAATRWRWVDRHGAPARASAVLVVTVVDLVALVGSLGLLLPASALARGADPAGRGWGERAAGVRPRRCAARQPVDVAAPHGSRPPVDVTPVLLARDRAARRPWLLEDDEGRRPAAGEWRTVALQPRADQLLARARSAGVVLARGRARRPLPLDRAVALREGDVLVAPDGRVRILRHDENLF